MSRDRLRVGALAGGGGSTFEAVVDATRDRSLSNFQPDLEVGLVISNNSKAGVWERARRLGVPIEHVSNLTQDTCTLPTFEGETIGGTISYEASGRMVELMHKYHIDILFGLGFMKRVIGAVIEEEPVGNSHPAILPLTAGLMMGDAQWYLMEFGKEASGPTSHWMTADKLDHRGLPAYDAGSVIGHEPVPITDEMRAEWDTNKTVGQLTAECMRVEKLMVPGWIVQAGQQL